MLYVIYTLVYRCVQINHANKKIKTSSTYNIGCLQNNKNKMPTRKQKLSLILPCYNEEANISFAYCEIMNTLKSIDIEYELVFVDDGSIDNTILEIENLQKNDRNILLIEFARNFGKEMATSAGINNCTGDGAIIVDVDMQYPIEKLPEFIAKWRAGADVVVGIRDKKKTNNLIEIIGSKTFYKVCDIISEIEIKSGALDYRLIDRKVIDEFKRFTEHGRMTRALIDWLGFQRDYVSYQEKPRQFGEPAYSFVKRCKLAFNTFIGTSLVPLKIAGWLGLIISLISGILGVVVIVQKYILDDLWGWQITGSASVGILNIFLTGVMLMGMGLMAIYVGHIHCEILNRPMYVIRHMSKKKR